MLHCIRMSLEQFEPFACPYCSQDNELLLDLTAGSTQELIVDCEVCCAPIVICLKIRGGEIVTMDVRRENE